MFKRIMVPVDGSAFAEAAVPVAATLARVAGAAVQLVQVHQAFPAAIPDVSAGRQVIGGISEDGHEMERGYLVQALGRLADGLVAEMAVLDGEPGAALLEQIDEWRADLVVMSTHGRGAVGRLLFGSVATYLIRNARIPMVLVRSSERDTYLATNYSLRSILVPLEFSAESDAILDPIIDLAGRADASVTLAHVVTPVTTAPLPGFPYPNPIDVKLETAAIQEADAYLDSVAERFRDRGIPVQAIALRGTPVAATLLSVLERGDYDLIALATHGRRGMSRALLGSVAEDILQKSPKPVMLIRTNGTGTGEG